MKLTTIKSKIVALLLAVAMILFVFFGTVSIVSMVKMRSEIKVRNSALGELASDKSTELVLDKTKDELVAITNGISDYSDQLFYKVESQLLVVASFLESIYYNEKGIYDQDKESKYGLLTKTQLEANKKEKPRSPLIHTMVQSDKWLDEESKPTASVENGKLQQAAQKELNLISPITPLLASTTTTNDLLTACYIASSTGFALTADVAAEDTSVEVNNFGGTGGVASREWYKKAAAVKTGEVIWTEIFFDSFGRGASLTCATPVFDKTGALRAVVAGSGIVEDYGAVVSNATIGESGKSFIVDNKANIIITTDKIPFDEDKKPIFNNLNINGDDAIKTAVPDIVGGKKGYVIGKYMDKEVLMAYSPIAAQPWSFVTIINMDEVLAPSIALAGAIYADAQASINALSKYINTTLIVIVVIMVVVLVLIVLFSNKFASGLTAPIIKLTKAVSKFGSGNLNEFIEIDSRDETRVLADAFNQMSIDLKSYINNLASITAEKERIGAELNVATQIQASMLPCIFPAFPDRKEFNIFACMHPAKEVGGDFYDFFLVDDNHLAVVIADVSGKGVPAALFMVIAKTLIKNHSQMGKTVGEVFTEANAQLCEGNDAGLFVTAWIGILEISTGKFTYSNAGHNPPLLKRKEGTFEFLRDRAGLVLAGMEGVRYKQFETKLNSGDVLFLYTDGVTEATNVNNELLGDDCLYQTVNKCLTSSPEQILSTVNSKITEFVAGEKQFDDITMLCLELNDFESKGK